jgi:hypothetical protein
VKSKGIPVLVFGGDKTKINIAYSPEDSITFYAARLASDLPDSINNIIVAEYNMKNKNITCKFVPLTEIVTSVANGTSNAPEKFVLYQNYPNPFNPTTEIRYHLPAGGTQAGMSEVNHVSLRVYDLLGREVATLVDEIKEAGMYEVKFNASKISSGVYFYRLQAGSFIETKRLLLLK